MRITNKIMQTNALNNINLNKILQDKLNTQMATQKKVSKPSDDPIVAIRALRLRSSVTEISQYYEKNIPDAEQWLTVTEDAIKSTVDVITDMIKQCTNGSNGDLTSEDRAIILEQLKALNDEVYATADADYAGRYVFTGYRTDTTLKYASKSDDNYSITEQLDKTNLNSVTVISTTVTAADSTVTDLKDVNSSNVGSVDITEADITAHEITRIQLAYNDLNAGVDPTIEWTNPDGSVDSITADTISAYDVPSPYEQIVADPDAVIFVPETGELLIGENVVDTLNQTKDNAITNDANEGEIRVTYSKNEWATGDLRPEHYFACTKTNADGTTIDYNQDYLDYTHVRQSIEYDIGYNQTIQVNTLAEECFDPGIGRTVDDLVSALEEYQNMETLVSNLQALYDKADEADQPQIQQSLDAAEKALALMGDKVQTMFENGITTMQGYLDTANIAITNCGTASSKLELAENRMQTQQTTFETLQSENEDIDITEVAIYLTSAQLTYEASLMAIGKLSQMSLLSYL